MAENERAAYQPLPGAGHRHTMPWWGILLLFFVIGIFALLLRGRRVRLWLGADHLLVVESDGYREFYRRFRYEDIQALTVRKTVEGKTVSAVAGGLAAVFIAMGLAVWNPGGTIFLLIIGGMFGAIAAINFFRGPTCECRLRTAVQSENLVSLGRLRHARKALELLRPRIVAAQGELTVEELYTKTQEAALAAAEDPDAPPVIGAIPVTPKPIVKPPPRPYRSRVHFILFCLLVADLPLTLAHIAYPESKINDVVGWGMLLLTGGFVIAGLVKQNNTDLPLVLRRTTWAALAFLGFFLITAIIYGFYVVLNNPDALTDNQSFYDDPVVVVMTTLSTGISVVLGVVGFIHLRKFRAVSNVSLPMMPPAA